MTDTTPPIHALFVGATPSIGAAASASDPSVDVDVTNLGDVDAALSWFDVHATECLVLGEAVSEGSRGRLVEAARAADADLPVLVVSDGDDAGASDESVETVPLGAADSLRGRVVSTVSSRRERRETAVTAHVDAVRERVADADVSDPQALFEMLCEALSEFDGYPFVWYGRGELRGGTLEPLAWSGPDAMTSEEFFVQNVTTGWGPNGRAALTTNSSVVHDIGGNEDFLPWLRRPPGHVDIHAVAAVPVTLPGAGVPFGQLAVYASYPRAFSSEERSALESLARTVADRLREFRDDEWRPGDGIGHEALREVVGAFPDLAVVYDEDGRYVDVLTPHQIRNFADPEDLVGEHLCDVLPEEAAEALFEAVQSAFETNEVERVEYPIEVGDEPLWYEAKVAPVDLSDGRRVAATTIRETTERKATERELARQKARIERLTSILSHDMGNHLGKASGWTELARDTVDGDAEELERVGEVLAEMETLLDRTVAMVRGSGDVPDTEPVDIGSVARQCWKNLPERGTLHVDSGLTPVVADPDRLAQLFENLLSNAVEHARPSVNVRIGTAEHGFYVADDGPGIDADEREHVFEFGYSTHSDGMGFGLAIVEGIADAHGWTVSVGESESGGARFEFSDVEWATVEDAG